MYCEKCRTPIICECGTTSNLNNQLAEAIRKKEINLVLCGESCREGSKEKCIKCNTKFEIWHTPKCPKCSLLILDTGCFMNDELSKLERSGKINYMVGKRVPPTVIKCVGCGTKIKY